MSMLGSRLSSRYLDIFLLSAGKHRTLYDNACPQCLLHAAHIQMEQPAKLDLEVDIWMENLCLESDIWSHQRVLLRNFENNLKYTTLKRGFFGSLQTVMVKARFLSLSTSTSVTKHNCNNSSCDTCKKPFQA